MLSNFIPIYKIMNTYNVSKIFHAETVINIVVAIVWY